MEAIWIGLTPHTVHVLRGAGVDAMLLDEARPENVAGKCVAVAPSAARGESATRVAVQRLRSLGGADVRVVETAQLNGGIDLADALEMGAIDGLSLARVAGEAPRSPAAGAVEPERVELVIGSDIRPEPIKWLWHGWLAAGKLHIIAGAPEAGKTSITLALAATLTIGGRWPDGTRAAPGTVVIWSGEDAIEDTLTPRLLALGADMTRVYFVRRVPDPEGMRPFDPARDMLALRGTLAGMGAKLVIVDPVVSAVTGDSHENARVRRALQPIVDLAEVLGCAVLGISHFSKGTGGRDPVERVTGSVAFGALPRLVFAAAKQPEEEGGRRIFVRAKSNIGVSGGGYEYRIEGTEIEGRIRTSQVLWGAALDGNARTLLANVECTDTGDHGAIADAKEFLAGELAGGPVAAKQIEKDANGAGHAWRTVQEAARRLGVVRRKGGMREGWIWALAAPVKMQPGAKMHEDASFQALRLRACSVDPAPSADPDSEVF